MRQETPGSDRADAGAGAARLPVAFMPYNRENRYWCELADNLEALGFAISDWGMLKHVWVAARRGEAVPRLLHIHWLPCFQWSWQGVRRWPVFLFYLALLRGQGFRFIWTAHDLYNPEPTCRWIDRLGTALALLWFSRVIVHTRTAGNLVRHHFFVRPARKVVEIPHGNYIGGYANEVPREEARRRLGLAADKVVLLFFGHIRPYKGVPELLDAFARLDVPDAVLVIAGKPLDAATVEVVRARIRHPERVLLHARFIADDDVQLYLNACDAVVFPYHYILTSGAVILAMSFGRACVASSLGCIPDVVAEGGAILYDPTRAEGLRDALAQAVEQRSELARMGLRNLERAREWGWDAIARRTAEVYREAVPEWKRRDLA